MKQAFFSLAFLAWVLAVAGCGGSSCSSSATSTTNCTTTTSTVTITLHPDATTTVSLGSTLQFTADVSGSSNTALTWEVNGTKGGNSTVGTITKDGLYTPPATVPSPNTVTVTAISQANTNDEANVGVVLVSGASISLSPTAVDLIAGKSQQFTAKVIGSTNTTVNWQVAGISGGNATVGTINSQGVYTAPSSLSSSPVSVAVTATAAVDATKTAQASVTLHNNLTVGLTPASVSVQTYAQQEFTPTVSNVSAASFTWQVNGVSGGNSTYGTIADAVDSFSVHHGIFTAPNHVPTVSTGSGSNLAKGGAKTTPVTVTAIYQGDSYFSASGTVTITSANQTSQSLPTTLGVSGGNGNDTGSGVCCGGTLGSLVSRGGQQYILSNSHVLARTDLGAVGDAIFQPGLFDTSCSTSQANQVATLSQFVNLESANSAAPVDAALALVLTDKVDSSGTILQLGSTNTADGQPTDGPPHAGSGVVPSLYEADGVTPLKVAKSGRSTGLTCSTVSAINFTASVTYEKACGTGNTFQQTYNDLIVVSGGSFSAEGDSGALIVTQDTADPIALLFASSDADSLGIPVSDVLSALAEPNTGEKPVFVGSTATHAVAGCSVAGAQSGVLVQAQSSLSAATSERTDAAARVRDSHLHDLLARPGVLGVGVGASLDAPSEAAVVLFVERGAATAGLPQQLDGIRVRIVEENSSVSPRGTFSAEETQSLTRASQRTTRAISEGELSRVREVHGKRVRELIQMSGIQGVGITASADAGGEAALLFYLVRGAQHETIPPVMDGVRTVIRESAPFRAGSSNALSARVCKVSAIAIK